eukprot:gene4345-6149_t
MIAANKRYLKANLTQGVLGIQTNLINLYANNLSAIATQAALIAGFSFTAVSSNFNSSNLYQLVLSYFYYVCFTVCLTAALFVLSQATIVVMFGPTLALKGNNDTAVKTAGELMLAQQVLIFKIAAVSITALFLGACLLSWSSYPFPIAAITTIVYVVTYYFLWTEGFKAYRIFVPNDDGMMIDSDNTNGTMTHVDNIGRENLKGYNKANTSDRNELIATAAAAQEAIKTKLKMVLWKRQSIENGGLFIQYFTVLEKGKLDFYAKEKDYRDNTNPINSKPIKLWQYDLETDPKKYSRTVTSLSSTVKSAMLGNEDFSMSDLLTSEHDLQLASKNYKFGLLPKVSSELMASTHHEFLAHDERAYSQWVTALKTVIDAYDLIAATPTIEHTIRIGAADVEMVVQAANNV